MMTTTLGAMGMTAVCASDGAAALASLGQQRPDAIVLDLLMPGMNGFDVLHALRQRPETAHLPVFVWTGMILSADDLAALARSAQAVVVKGQGGVDVLVGQISAWSALRQRGTGRVVV